MREGAALAFYAVFSSAPFLFLLSKIATLAFGIPTIEAGAVHGVGRVAGASGGDLIQAMIGSSYHSSPNPIIGLIGVAVLIFGSTNFFIQINDAFDVMAGLHPEAMGWRSFFTNRLKACLLILLTGILLALFLFTTTAISTFGNFLAAHFMMPVWFLFFLNFALSFAVAVLLFALIYRYLPTQALSWRHAMIGALSTAALLVAGEYVLSWIFGEGLIGSYGIAGALIAFMTWIYYSSLLFLFGAEIAYAYAEPHDDGAGNQAILGQ